MSFAHWQVFFCIVGTLVALAVVVHQGDYRGHAESLAAHGAQQAAARAAALSGNLPGYRTTPGSGDPYQYIRTGHYATILAHEEQVQRQAHQGSFATPHMALDRWTEVHKLFWQPPSLAKEGLAQRMPRVFPSLGDTNLLLALDLREWSRLATYLGLCAGDGSKYVLCPDRMPFLNFCAGQPPDGLRSREEGCCCG